MPPSNDAFSRSFDRLANALQRAVGLATFVERVTAANLDDCAKLSAALREAVVALDAMRRPRGDQ